MLQPVDLGPTYYYVEAHAGTPDVKRLSNVVSTTIADKGGCFADAGTLCLVNARFEVRAKWQLAGSSVVTLAHAMPRTDQSGYFWFFTPDNVEVTLKVLNACPAAYWVFASGMTNVGVEISVRDRKTFRTRTYSNPPGTPFAPILDTNAFSCQ